MVLRPRARPPKQPMIVGAPFIWFENHVWGNDAMFVPNKIKNNKKYYMWTLNKRMSFGLNQINGYIRRGLHLERFDPSRPLIEPKIWIYAGIIDRIKTW